MFEDVIDIDRVCRLCLNQDGNMSRIHDGNKNQTEYTLCDKILLLAAVQITPDDGLPSLICEMCHEKIEQFIIFKEQIEHSYNILCQCIQVASDAKTPSHSNVDAFIVQAFTEDSAKENFANDGQSKEKNVKANDNCTNISSLFKDHLVSGISENEMLVNQDFGFVNVGNISYINSSNDTTDNYMSVALQEDSIHVQNDENLLSKDNEIVTQNESNGDANLSYIKSINGTNDAIKTYNISYIDGNHDNLHDIFLGLENDENEVCNVNGFEDISQYLKSSHGLDIKKLKEDFRSKEVCSDVDQEVLKKKLINNGISLIKSTVTDSKIVQKSKSDENSAKNDEIKMENFEFEDEDKFPDMVFAKMSIFEKDKYTMADNQKEIFPRIVQITHLDVDSPDTQFKFVTHLCHLCLMEFRESGLAVLENHSNSHFSKRSIIATCQNEPTFTCEECVERFTTRYNFINHQRKELNVKVFGCGSCGKYFCSREKLNLHSRVHSTDHKTYSCLFCSEVFDMKQVLQSHELTHTRDMPLICQHCDKEFGSIGSLKSHIRRHTESAKYCCEVCGKGFYCLSQLKRHEQGHSGVRKFPCQFCPKSFFSNAERRRHLLYHFKNKRFQCEKCDKKFYEAGHLKIHMQSHTNHKPFICDMCPNSFHTRYKLKRHLKNRHKTLNLDSDVDSKTRKDGNKPSAEKLDTVVEPKFTKLCKVNMEGSDNHYLYELIENMPEEDNEEEEETDGGYIIVQGLAEDEESQIFYLMDDTENTKQSV